MRTPEVIEKWLKDCDAYTLGYIHQLEAQVPKWISVEERLPKHGEMVVCSYVFEFSREPCVNVLQYHAHDVNGCVTGAHFTDEGLYGMRVTHWMPLPEPPQEDAHENSVGESP